MSYLNPFLTVSRFIGNQYNANARQLRDAHEGNQIHQALAAHAAQFEATKQHTTQQARLTEKSEVGRTNRATEFHNQLHEKSQPGTQVNFKHGDISASYTSKMPTPSVSTNKVPVKRNRGGRRPH